MRFCKKKITDEADVYVINTCSVTENADKECRQLVRKVQRQSPEAMVVIIGCYARLLFVDWFQRIIDQKIQFR